jgi:hypothetical protein
VKKAEKILYEAQGDKEYLPITASRLIQRSNSADTE